MFSVNMKTKTFSNFSGLKGVFEKLRFREKLLPMNNVLQIAEKIFSCLCFQLLGKVKVKARYFEPSG